MVFLKKFYPLEKTARVRNEITNFHQKGVESFWQYFERFKELLLSCPHHGYETWSLCQTVYDGLDNSTRQMLESMCQGNFLKQTDVEAWEFLDELAK